MSNTRSDQHSKSQDWPTFALRYTFNLEGIALEGLFDPDEVVVFDATRGRPDNRWIAAKSGSYLSLEKIR